MPIANHQQSPRQSMAGLHRWVSVVFGALLYVIFFTGSLSFYQQEISLWMQPELHRSVDRAASTQQLEHALQVLQQRAPRAERWEVQWPNERQSTLNLSYVARGEQRHRHQAPDLIYLDATTGQQLYPRATQGGHFLSNFHFQLYALPHVLARWIVGLATLLMLVALISGIIAHKKIFQDFFTFRPNKGQRSWLDAHNASAVFALPFYVMICLSGLLLLIYTLMPWAIKDHYPDGRAAFFQALNAEQRGQQPTLSLPAQQHHGARHEAQARALPQFTSLPMADLKSILLLAQAQSPTQAISAMTLVHPNHIGAQVEFRAAYSEDLIKIDAIPSQHFDAITAALRPTSASNPSGIIASYNLLTALHLGHVLTPLLRMLLFGAGLLGCGMIASGLLLWGVKRRNQLALQQRVPSSIRVVEVLNISVIMGLAIACAGYFYANRLLPVQLEARADAEIGVFFSAWLLMLIHAAIRPHRQAWLEQLLLALMLYALLPILNFLTGGLAFWHSAWQGQWMLFGVDMMFWSFAALFAYGYHKLKRHPGKAAAAYSTATVEA